MARPALPKAEALENPATPPGRAPGENGSGVWLKLLCNAAREELRVAPGNRPSAIRVEPNTLVASAEASLPGAE